MPSPLMCRAHVSERCMHGQVVPGWRFDGTYDGGSIVCDFCYAQIIPLTPSGRGRNDELDTAIRELRANAMRAPIVQTLRFLAGGWIRDDAGHDNQQWLTDVADQIERDPDPANWDCCPICEEVTCDNGCPLSEVRATTEKGT